MPSHPVFKAGNTALITGAASGVGLAVAQLCRKHGMNLALVDNNSQNLEEAKESLAAGGDGEVQMEAYCMDVSKIEEWKGLREKVESKFKNGVQLLMLNAGIGPKSSWEDPESFQRIFATNFFGTTNGLSTFLPLLHSSPTPGAIVLTGSKQGLTNPPGNPAYNASKAALKSVAESLSFDLRSDDSVSVHLLVPGWTYTGLTGGGGKGEKPEGAWWPAQVAGFLEGAMAEGRFYVLCPDNDTTQEKDKRRMLWSVGDVVEGRPALSRWREEWKGRAEEWMAGRGG